MAEHDMGDLLTYQASAGEVPAIVVEKQSSTQATIRVLSPTGPDDDYLIGPSTGYTTDPTAVLINDTAALGTASVSGSGRVAQDLRDDARFLPVQSFEGGSWSRPTPFSLRFATLTPNSSLWLEYSSLTDFTELDFEVQHNIGSTITVNLYRNDGSNSPIVPVTWTSDPAISAWQSKTLVIGSTYPAPLDSAVYFVEIISGPNIPGVQFFNCRNIKLRAAPIVV